MNCSRSCGVSASASAASGSDLPNSLPTRNSSSTRARLSRPSSRSRWLACAPVRHVPGGSPRPSPTPPARVLPKPRTIAPPADLPPTFRSLSQLPVSQLAAADRSFARPTPSPPATTVGRPSGYRRQPSGDHRTGASLPDWPQPRRWARPPAVLYRASITKLRRARNQSARFQGRPAPVSPAGGHRDESVCRCARRASGA
jgi:hypothetical protein